MVGTRATGEMQMLMHMVLKSERRGAFPTQRER